MARARNIKPGFFTNEDLVELDFATRLLFAGLWTVADREGRLQDRPKKIKIDVFPADNLDIDAMLQALHERKFITRYEVNGGKFIQISSWSKHQNPHHTEKASEIPDIDGELTVKEPLKPSDPPNHNGGNLADSLIPDSLIPDSPIQVEEKVAPPRQSAPPPSPPPPFDGLNAEVLNGKSIVNLAPNWELPDDWGEDAEALGWQPGEVLREAEKFRQYWVAGKGLGKRRNVKGWRQSWSNWLAKAAENRR